MSVGLPRAEAILEGAGDRKTLQSWIARPVAGFYAMQGRFDEARELLANARVVMEELARTLEARVLAFWTGPLELLSGDPAAAEREYRAACEYLQSKGEKGWLSTLAAMWAETLYQQDRLDEAAAAVLLSRETSTSDDYDAQALWRWAEAKLLARRGEFAEAEELGREAVAIIDRTDEVNHHALLRLGLAEVLWLAERPEEARSQAERALELYEQKENDVMAERVRKLLAEQTVP